VAPGLAAGLSTVAAGFEECWETIIQ
jgi:hypothetical protein